MSEPLQRVSPREAAADSCRRSDRLPAVARSRSCSRGARDRSWRTCRRGCRRRSGDAGACRHRPAVRARSRGADLSGLGLPALRPCLPCSSVMAERLATLNALQAQARKAAAAGRHRNAATQRLLTPFRIRQLTRRIAPGERIERERLVAQLNAIGYQRIDTVAEHGEYRGPRVADRSLSRRRDHGASARLLRRRDREPPPFRSCRPAHDRQVQSGSLCSPRPKPCSTRTASSASARATARSSARPRPTTRSTRHCPRDAACRAWSIGCRCSRNGSTPCSTISATTIIVIRDAAADQAPSTRRREAIDDYYQNRVRAMEGEPGSYRPLEPHALYLSRDGVGSAEADRPLHLASPFHEPESERGHRLRRRTGARLRARAVAAGERLRSGCEACRRPSPQREEGRARKLHARRARAAERLARGSRAEGAKARRDLAGSARLEDSAARSLVLPLDHGFTTPDVAVLTEQDMLGDRLVRRRKQRKPQRRSSRSSRRSRPATSSFTPTTASAATRA